MPALGPFSTTLAVTIDMEGLPDTGLDTSAWTAGTLPPLVDIVDVNDLQIAAKNTLAGADYAYYRTAALDEVTYNANLFIWEKIRLNGFSFAADVSDGNLTPSILGHEFNAPFFIAPATQAGRGGPGAETNLVQAAGAAGILYVPSISSTQSIQTVRRPRTGSSCFIRSTSGPTTLGCRPSSADGGCRLQTRLFDGG